MTVGTPFTKGHGTQNDFVVVPDFDGARDLTESDVRRLCDRRAGIGGDGLIRVVRTAAAGEPQIRDLADQATWFMDYRNADGSRAQMCGNGTRVFAAYLRRAGLVAGDSFAIATRAGVKALRVVAGEGADQYAVDLGRWRLIDESTAEQGGYDSMVLPAHGRQIPGLSIDVGNEHTVVMLPEELVLEHLDLTTSPVVTPAPPNGSNVEFVRMLGPGHIAMRVYERGVGETRSCGTGAAAAAVATHWWAGGRGTGAEWLVDVPGGRLAVRIEADRVELQGPAELVADGTTTLI